MISFEDFLSRLATSGAEPFESRVAWVTFPETNPYFVPPNLELETSGPDDSPVILVSAPGAVGKTTFAEAVAHSRRAPVFDLAKRRVGTDAFLGLIANAFGYERVSAVYDKLKAGECLVVLDALDETRVGSGLPNFEGFLEDLAVHFKGHRSRPSVLLLARVDTADLVATALELHDVSYQRYRIALFNESAARQFVDRYLDARYDEAGVGRAHRAHRAAFEPVRDRLFAVLKTAAADDRTIELLGYAPVLVTLAEQLYEERNYHALGVLLDRSGSEGAWNLLAVLAEDLLAREQTEKFRRQLPADLLAAVPDALSPDEQCFWLLLEYVGMRTRLSTPQAVPTHLSSTYEDSVESQMTEHPFRREKGIFQHIVFREYVLGWYLTRLPRDQKDVHDEIRHRLLSMDDFLPTPLLGRFALGVGRRAIGRSSGVPLIAGDDLGFLYESFLAQADKDRRPWLILDSIDPADQINGMIGVGEAGIHTAELRVADTGNGVWFWRHLAGAQVHVSCRVELGVQGGEFVLGPDVEIEAGEFSCPVRHLVVRADNGDRAVVIDAKACREPSQPSLRCDGAFFRVRWPRLSYPWIRHELSATGLQDSAADMLDAYTHLARILKRLRAYGYGEVARHRDIIENIATGRTATGKAMLRYCVEKGVILAKGELFVLNDSRAAEFGINWSDLRLRTMNDKIRDFLSGFLRSRSS